ncbi:MAG: hypothetical protein WCE63_16685 [Acidobacteriaceae bacterium]
MESIEWLQAEEESSSASSIANWYARLRSSSTKALLKGESAAALKMADALPARLSAEATRTKRAAKR